MARTKKQASRKRGSKNTRAELKAAKIHKQRRVIDLLQSGFSVKNAMEAVGHTTGLYYSWRRQSEEFKKRTDSLVHRRSNLPGGSFARIQDKRLWTFLDTWKRTGNRNQALAQADVSALLIEAILNEESPEYDENFALRYRDIELRHLWEVEDNTIDEAQSKGGTTGRFVLQARLPERYNKPLMTSMKTYGDNQLPERSGTNLMFFQIGDSERSAGEILERIFSKFIPPTEIGKKEVSDGRHDLPNQEARADVQVVDLPDGNG